MDSLTDAIEIPSFHDRYSVGVAAALTRWALGFTPDPLRNVSSLTHPLGCSAKGWSVNRLCVRSGEDLGSSTGKCIKKLLQAAGKLLIHTALRVVQAVRLSNRGEQCVCEMKTIHGVDVASRAWLSDGPPCDLGTRG